MITEVLRNLPYHRPLSNVNPNDHHIKPSSGTFNDTTTVISAGASHVKYFTIPTGHDYKNINVTCKSIQKESCCIVVASDQWQSCHSDAFKYKTFNQPGYGSCFDKNRGAWTVSDEIFSTLGDGIVCVGFVIYPTYILAIWVNRAATSRTLWTKGTWTAW